MIMVFYSDTLTEVVFFKGCGDNNSRNVPTLVKDVSNVGQVACGSAHTICISKDGCTVWSFGSGDNGELFSVLFCSAFLLLINLVAKGH